MRSFQVSASQSFGDPWHGAEAFHFLMLSQRQLIAGQLADAMHSALRLADYEDIIEPVVLGLFLCSKHCASTAKKDLFIFVCVNGLVKDLFDYRLDGILQPALWPVLPRLHPP
jgi:hypothetical protein